MAASWPPWACGEADRFLSDPLRAQKQRVGPSPLGVGEWLRPPEPTLRGVGVGWVGSAPRLGAQRGGGSGERRKRDAIDGATLSIVEL